MALTMTEEKSTSLDVIKTQRIRKKKDGTKKRGSESGNKTKITIKM